MMRSAIFAAAFVAAPLSAQTSAPVAPAAPAPAALAAARDLMTATDVQGQMRAMMPRMADAVGTQLRQMFIDKKVPDGLRQQFTAAIQANVASTADVLTPAVLDEIAVAYARHFSADELKRLATLMRDPVMVRFRTGMPDVTAEIMPIMFTAMKPRQEAFQATMQQIVADWIRQHPQDKAKLHSPTAS